MLGLIQATFLTQLWFRWFFVSSHKVQRGTRQGAALRPASRRSISPSTVQESNPTLGSWRSMNMAPFRGIRTSTWQEERRHLPGRPAPGLRADFVMANPPSTPRTCERVTGDDARWKYVHTQGQRQTSLDAAHAHHLAPNGSMAYCWRDQLVPMSSTQQ